MGRQAGVLCALWSRGLRKLAAAALVLILGFFVVATWVSGDRGSGIDTSTHWFGSSLQWQALVPSPCARRMGGGVDLPARCRNPPRHEALDEPAFQQQIPVLDRWHNHVGMRTQWDVHTLGLWHESAAVLVFDGSRLLLQQRSAHKWTYPSAWDASVAETMEADELPATAAARGALEELGAAIQMQFAASKPVCWVGRQPEMDLADCEIVHFFVARDPLDHAAFLELDTDAGRGDDASGRGELQALRWVELEELGKEIEAKPGSFTPLLLSAWYELADCWGSSAAGHALPARLLGYQ
jgi:isopentenyldiphosphate isomerase